MKFGYARVSLRDMHPENQIHELMEKGGVKEENIFVDKGVSGRKASRPQWDILLSRLREDDMLYVVRLDRMGRSVINLVNVVKWLEDHKVGLVVTAQGIDTSTPVGKFTFHVLAALAEMEAELIKERTMDGLSEAARKGHKAGPSKTLSAQRVASLKRRYENGDDIGELTEDYGISRASLYRYVRHGGGRKPE